MTAGWTVPGFTTVRELGRGSSGPVVVAVDDDTRTQVAIRYLTERLRTDATFMGRFRDEAAALSRLEDDNLVDLYAYVEEPGGSAIVMELVDGVSLRRVLATQGPTGPLAALTIFGGSLLGLAAAHGAGLIHRAYKPENVLIRRDGLAKVSDLGLLIEAGGAIDAASYLAPELWGGALPSVGSDLYAATAVFFECLTGHPPYAARKPMDLARAHQSAPIPLDAVPGPLDALVAHGLAKSQAERPTSAADLLGELDDAAVAAYGSSWESQGRDRLAEMVAAAERAPDPPPERKRGSRTARTSARIIAVPAEPPRAAGSTAGEEAAFAGSTPTAGRGLADYAVAADTARAAESRASRDSRGSFSADAPSRPASHRAGTHPAQAGGERRGRKRSRVIIGAAVVLGAALAAGGTVWAISGGGGPAAATGRTPAPGISTPPPINSDGKTAEPETPDTLAGKISTALADRPGAAFSYRGPGGLGGPGDSIAANGTFRYVSKAAGSYDMTVSNPGDKKYGKSLRTIIVGNTAYVANGGFKKAPAVRTAGPKADPPHVYAAMAANARWATSPTGLLAILHAGTELQASGTTYTGTASLAQLAQADVVAPFYGAFDNAKYQLSYTLRVDGDYLPERLDVRLSPVGGKAAAVVLHTVYGHWNRKTSIAAPTRAT